MLLVLDIGSVREWDRHNRPVYLYLHSCSARLMSALGPIRASDVDYIDAKRLTRGSNVEISGLYCSAKL
jgi:hypothetical protein